MVYSSKSRKELEAQAKERGAIIIDRRKDVLQLDLDTPMSPKNEQVYQMLLEKGVIDPALEDLVTVSPGGNQHRYIRLSKKFFHVDLGTVIGFQAALGSDPVREAIAMLNYWNDEQRPLVLFETPEEATRVQKWQEAEADV